MQALSLRYLDDEGQWHADWPPPNAAGDSLLTGLPRSVEVGAEQIREAIEGDLKALVDEKCAVLTQWMDEGRIARLSPYHLIFSIWSLTQHYADFDVQVRAVLGEGHDPFAEAQDFLQTLFTRLLRAEPV